MKNRTAFSIIGAVVLVLGFAFWPRQPRTSIRSLPPCVGSDTSKAAEIPGPRSYSLFARPYRVLAKRIVPSDSQGVVQHEWLLESGESYGPIRIEEQIRKGPADNSTTVIRREAFVAGEVLVRPRDDASRGRFLATLAELGAEGWDPIFGSAYWRVRWRSPTLDTKPSALAALARHADTVLVAEGNGLGTTCSIPDDPRFPEQYSLQNTGQDGGLPGADIRMVEAWKIRRTSPDVVVAILDVGINYRHPDIGENIYHDPRETPDDGIDDDGNGFVDDWQGWDFVQNDNDPDPYSSHATGAASIIGACGNNALGIAGISWKVQLLNVKVNGATGTTANLVAGINYARTKGARIMSMSLGGYPYSQATIDAIEAARTADILLVIAAGNTGTDNDVSPFYPASYAMDNILAVANTNNLDELNLSLSSYGLRSVDLGAPGTRLLGLGLDDGYRYGNGTSSATPHVAGVAALLRQMRPEAKVADLRRWILDTVDPLPSLAGRCVSGGRLNAYAALRAGLARPMVVDHPVSQTVDLGAAAELSVSAISPRPLSYQWLRDGQPISGATSATLRFTHVTPDDAGDYTVLVGDSGGTVTSRLARLVVSTPDEGRLVNMSVRAIAGANGEPLMVGFTVTGGSKRLLFRAAGPSLAELFGVPGALNDPRLDVHQTVNGGDQVILTNDNWADAPASRDAIATACAQVGAFPFVANSRDAALLLDVDGVRSAHAYGTSEGSSGIVLIEGYDTGSGNSARLVNLSARNQVGTGNDVLIAGFVINGNTSKRLLIRGVGPTLYSLFGIANAIIDPRLELHARINGVDTVLAENDDWDDEPGAGDAAVLANAFPLPPGHKDAAIVMTLPAGSYTAVVSGVGNTTGNGLVEVYELP